MGRATRATWTARVEAWKQSKLTAKEFAAKHGLLAGTLSWWSWRLGAERRRRSVPNIELHSERATIAPLTFVEMTASLHAEPIEIVLRNELRVRVTTSFDLAALVRVLDVLERR